MSTANTTVVSIRLKSKTSERLKKLADEERVTPSALIGHILDSYLEWETFAPKVGMLPMHKETVKLLLASLNDDQLKQVAYTAAIKFMDAVVLITGELTLAGFLDLTKIRLSRSGIAFNHIMEDGKMRFIINHRMGRKWSVFFCALCSTIVQKLGYFPKAEVTDDMWIMTIALKH